MSLSEHHVYHLPSRLTNVGGESHPRHLPCAAPKQAQQTMGRRNRQTNAEWLITTLARLPWWACLLVGLTGYLVCASVAQSPAPTLHAGNLGQGITAAWIKG